MSGRHDCERTAGAKSDDPLFWTSRVSLGANDNVENLRTEVAASNRNRQPTPALYDARTVWRQAISVAGIEQALALRTL